MVDAKHAFVSAKSNGADATLVRPSNWNEAHKGVQTIVNVRDYGAVGNGTTDDSAAIQAALDAVPALPGGAVYIPVGRYRILSTLVLDANQRVIGEGAGSSYNASVANSPGSVLVLETDSIAAMETPSGGSVHHQGPVVENIAFHGNTPTAYTGIGLSIRRMNHWTVRNCSFRDFNYGIDILADLDAAWGLIDQCIFRLNWYGIRGADGMPNRVTGCDITSIEDPASYGIYIGTDSQARLTNVKFDGGGTHIYSRAHATTIIGCHFEDPLTAAIELDGQVSPSEDGKGHKVIGCQFRANPSAGVGIKISAGIKRPPIIFGNTWVHGMFTKTTDASTIGYYRYDDRGQFRMIKPAVTTSLTIEDDDSDLVRVDATAANRTITLPTIAANLESLKGMIRTIMKIDSSANTVTVDGGASETINGATTKVLGSQYASITIVCDGTNWVITSSTGTVT